jgi:CRP/FNR family transcriptional regulator
VPAGTVLFGPDDRFRGFVMVRSGTNRVVPAAENGREIVLYGVQPGDVGLQTFACLVEEREALELYSHEL